AAAVGLIPPGADAGLAGAAVVEEDRELAGLGPVHLRLPLVGAEPAAADVVLDEFLRVLALDVADLAVDDEVLFAVHLFDAHEEAVGGLVDAGAEAHGGFDVSVRGPDPKGRQQGAGHDRRGRTKPQVHPHRRILLSTLRACLPRYRTPCGL